MVIAQLIQPLIDETNQALALLEMGAQQSRFRASNRHAHSPNGMTVENGTAAADSARSEKLAHGASAKCWSFSTCHKLRERNDNEVYKPLHEPVLVSHASHTGNAITDSSGNIIATNGGPNTKRPNENAPIHVSANRSAKSQRPPLPCHRTSDAPSMVAGVVVGTWKSGSLKRPTDLAMPLRKADVSDVGEPETPIFLKSTTSLYSDISSLRTVDTPDYFLSDASHDMLMQIIRCFPFPTPKSSPKLGKRQDSKASLPGCCQAEPSSSAEFDDPSASVPLKSKRPHFTKHNNPVTNLFHRNHFKHGRKRAGSSKSEVTDENPASPSRPHALSTTSAPGTCHGSSETIGSIRKGALSRLCQVSVDTMAITALPLDCWLKERLKNWVQLSGHEGTIVPATNQTLWKKQPSGSSTEAQAYEKIMADSFLAGMTPHYFKEIEHKSESFIEIQDLLSDFPNTSTRAIMDIKIGTRTFLESEVSNCKKRADLYKKMIDIDPNEPTEEERVEEAITKLRYMQFRERESSSASLGFRIEAAQMPGGKLQKSFKKVRTHDQVVETLKGFFGDRVNEVARQLEKRLTKMRAAVEKSDFFRRHEVVGSSILIIFDEEKSGAWMIDFAKSTEVPEELELNHRTPWEVGNHEDGYLVGLDNLIQVLAECHS